LLKHYQTKLILGKTIAFALHVGMLMDAQMHYFKNFHIKLRVRNHLKKWQHFRSNNPEIYAELFEDNEAKWDIEKIFVDNLDASFFTDQNA
jgi:hypothetical protein